MAEAAVAPSVTTVYRHSFVQGGGEANEGQMEDLRIGLLYRIPSLR